MMERPKGRSRSPVDPERAITIMRSGYASDELWERAVGQARTARDPFYSRIVVIDAAGTVEIMERVERA